MLELIFYISLGALVIAFILWLHAGAYSFKQEQRLYRSRRRKVAKEKKVRRHWP